MLIEQPLGKNIFIAYNLAQLTPNMLRINVFATLQMHIPHLPLEIKSYNNTDSNNDNTQSLNALHIRKKRYLENLINSFQHEMANIP